MIITEAVNVSALVLEGKERLSDVVFQLDVWDNSADRKRTEKIAAEADKLMLAAGFRRTAGHTVKEKNLQRKTMRYAGKIDSDNFRVYNK